MLSKELHWLLRQALPFRGLYLLQLSAVGLVSLLGLLDPLILKWLIDEVLTWRKAGMLPVVALAFFGFFLFRFTFSAMNALLDVYTAQRLTFDIRRRVLRHLQMLSPDFFLSHSRGDLLHRLENDIEQITTLGGKTLASMLRIVVMTLLSIVIMLLLDWQLTLCVLPLVPIMLMLRRVAQPPLRRASERVQEAVGRRYGFFESQLAQMIQVQLLNRQASERRRFGRLGRHALDATVKRRVSELGLSFSYQITITIAGAAVLGFGGYRVLQGALTIGGLVAFYSYLVRIFEPMGTLVQLYSEFMRAGVSIRRVMTLFEAEPRVHEPAEPLVLPPSRSASIALRGVGFAYSEGGSAVLGGLDLEIGRGEKVAFVGTSGGGKSTLARLLTRQYDVQAGEITIEGRPIQKLRLKELRRQVALVPQDPALFDVSLRENLLYGNGGADDEALRNAIALAELDGVIEGLEDGWNTPVGQRGDLLSGGQRQRVAIARAVLQATPILILDEATSALDGFTEQRLLQKLRHTLAERTVLVIAHRLSAILWADRVVVIDGGRVIDDGPHALLYGRCAAYRQLVDEQLLPEGQDLEANGTPGEAIYEVASG